MAKFKKKYTKREADSLNKLNNKAYSKINQTMLNNLNGLSTGMGMNIPTDSIYKYYPRIARMDSAIRYKPNNFSLEGYGFYVRPDGSIDTTAFGGDLIPNYEGIDKPNININKLNPRTTNIATNQAITKMNSKYPVNTKPDVTTRYRRSYIPDKGFGYYKTDYIGNDTLENQFITPKQYFNDKVTNPNYGGNNFKNGGMIYKNFKSKKLADGGSADFVQLNPNNIDTSLDWGTIGSGALTGAGTGFTVGSAFPGAGNIIGGAAGLLVGGGLGTYEAISKQNAAKDQQQHIINQNNINRQQWETNRYRDYNNGIDNTNTMFNYYSKGGKIGYKKGGKIKRRTLGEGDYEVDPITLERIGSQRNAQIVQQPNGEKINSGQVITGTNALQPQPQPNFNWQSTMGVGSAPINAQTSGQLQNYSGLAGQIKTVNNTVSPLYRGKSLMSAGLNGVVNATGNAITSLLPYSDNNIMKGTDQYLNSIKQGYLNPVNTALTSNNPNELENINTEAGINAAELAMIPGAAKGLSNAALNSSNKVIGTSARAIKNFVNPETTKTLYGAKPISTAKANVKLGTQDRLQGNYYYNKNIKPLLSKLEDGAKVGIDNYDKWVKKGMPEIVKNKSGDYIIKGNTPTSNVSTFYDNQFKPKFEVGKNLNGLNLDAGKIHENPINIINKNVPNYPLGKTNTNKTPIDLSNSKKFKNLYEALNTMGLNYAKGGSVAGLNIKAPTTRIGNGLQVNATKSGTDTVNAGNGIKLDNKEIVVNYQGSPVVISDDLGEADKYRAEIAAGGNPDMVAAKYAQRAMILNPNPGNKGALGWWETNPKYNNITNLNDTSNSNDSINNINTKSNWLNDNASGIASGLNYLGTTVGNISAIHKMNKLGYPTYQATIPTMMNENANRPMFNNRVNEINSTFNNINKQVLDNTANSNVAMNRLSALNSNRIGAVDKIRSGQLADKNRISNLNVATNNKFALYNNQQVNNNNINRYNDSLGRINTTNALIGSTAQGLDNIIENMKKDKYQNEYLQTVAKMYNLDVNDPNFSIDSLDEASRARLAELLKPYITQ